MTITPKICSLLFYTVTFTENVNVTLLCFESFLNMNRCNIIQYVYDGK